MHELSTTSLQWTSSGPPVRSYGSTPGELAACVRNVGLVRRADLTAITASGPSTALELLTAHLVGHALAIGGSAQVAAARGCRPAADTLMLIGPPEALDRTAELLRTASRRRPGLVVHTSPAPLDAIGVVGRQTGELLRSLGVYGRLGDPRATPPCVMAAVNDSRTMWLLESDVSAICFVERTEAAAVDRCIAEAGRAFGLARVGQDALAQYQLLERRRPLVGVLATA